MTPQNKLSKYKAEPMKPYFRIAIYFAVGVPTVCLVAGYLWLLRSLPSGKDEMIWPALHNTVTVEGDHYGIPVIKAENRVDAIRALGYVTARDRLFQMDLMRRKNGGRLAEIFGVAALANDVRSRNLGFNRVARTIAEQLPVAYRRYLEAYASGVNRFLEQAEVLPFEFTVLGFRPEPWKIEDSILVALGMFDMLTASAEQEERMLTVMAATLPNDVFDFLTPKSDGYTDALMNGSPAVAASGSAIPEAAMAKLLAKSSSQDEIFESANWFQADASIPGSNAWAVGAQRTADGRAILANDMHLGISVPAIWYRAQIEFAGHRAAGVTLPGFPVIVAGSNQHISWGQTNLTGDFLDLVQLQINPDDYEQYQYRGEWLNFDRIVENIAVKDDESLSLTVRESRWGPVSTEPLLGSPVAVHWTALDGKAFNMALIDMETATSIDQAIGIAHRSSGPQLNLLLADNRGHIAWTILGLIPQRLHFDGSVSRSWADGETGWPAYVPEENIPVERDPPSGLIVSANHRRFSDHLPFVIGRQFASGYRAYRITERLARMHGIQESDLFELQLDSETNFYRFYQNLALSVLNPVLLEKRPELTVVRDYLGAWDGRADTQSLGLPLLVEFRKQLANSVFWPLLSACRQSEKQFHYAWTFIDKPLQALLSEKPQKLLPDSNHYQDWDGFIVGQLILSVQNLQERHPATGLSELTWGEVNQSHYVHPFSTQVPGLGWLLDMPVDALPGCVECVRVATPRFGASERMVISPGHWQDGVLHIPGGQSSHPLSPHFRDQFIYWLKGLALPFGVGSPETKMIMKPAIKS